MAREEFNDNFWNWAAYDLNWINIAQQERWLDSKGCPFDCNEEGIQRLRDGLQVYLDVNAPEVGTKLEELLTILDKYQNKAVHELPPYEDDVLPVSRLLTDIINAVPELKEREITLSDWVNNGNERKGAFYAGQEGPAPILQKPAAM